jgi:hypothetical protein
VVSVGKLQGLGNGADTILVKSMVVRKRGRKGSKFIKYEIAPFQGLNLPLGNVQLSHSFQARLYSP